MLRPPCGRSRDQNFGHVTKQAAAGRRWQPAPRDRTKVMPPVGKDKIEKQRGSWTSDPGAQLRIDTPVTAVQRTCLPRTVRIPSAWLETRRCGRPSQLVEKRNFATARSRRHRRAATNHSPHRDYTEPRTVHLKSGRLCARVYLGHSSGSRLAPTFFCPPSCKLDLCC